MLHILLYIGKGELPEIPSHVKQFDIEFIKIENTNRITSDPNIKTPNIIIVDYENNDGLELVLKCKSRWEKTPIFALLEESSYSQIKEAYEAGAYNTITKPLSLDRFYNLLLQSRHILAEDNDYMLLLKNMIQSEQQLQEKTTVLETTLDILSHDSKNIFVGIWAILKQLEKNPVRSMLEDFINELFDNLMESISYLKAKKRIFSLIEIMNDIQVTSEQIPISSHRQIKIVHDSRYLLFIEATRLVKNVITNIIENAIKYSGEGNEITVSLQRKNEHVFIHVADKGNGIPDEEKKDIFKRYYSRKQTLQTEGTGRRLWITSNIIKNEGGELTVSDNKGGGTVFTIKLPAFKIDYLDKELIKLSEWYDLPIEKIKDKASTIQTIMQLQNFKDTYDMPSLIFVNLLECLRIEKKEQEQNHYHKKLMDLKENSKNSDKKVLIIDDSVYVHYYLASHLTELGYGIANFAKNGEDGVNLFKYHKPDIVTCDMTMPIMSGLEAAKHIFKIDKNAKIIFITALGSNQNFIDNLNKILPNLNFQILTKPMKKEELKDILTKMIPN